MKKDLIFLISGFGLLCFYSICWALPQGEGVVNGLAGFDRPNDNTLNITASDKVIINYDSFSIAQDELVRFIQPSSNSVALNKGHRG